MSDAAGAKPLTGWQRANVLAAAQYLRDVLMRSPSDRRARALCEALLEVLDPTRRVAREHREQRHASASLGSMWDQRSGRERRDADRRAFAGPLPAGGERRVAQRRSGRDRREARG